MVTEIRSVEIKLTIDTNHATHDYDYALKDYDYEVGVMLEDIREQIEYWLNEEGK